MIRLAAAALSGSCPGDGADDVDGAGDAGTKVACDCGEVLTGEAAWSNFLAAAALASCAAPGAGERGGRLGVAFVGENPPRIGVLGGVGVEFAGEYP